MKCTKREERPLAKKNGREHKTRSGDVGVEHLEQGLREKEVDR